MYVYFLYIYIYIIIMHLCLIICQLRASMCTIQHPHMLPCEWHCRITNGRATTACDEVYSTLRARGTLAKSNPTSVNGPTVSKESAPASGGPENWWSHLSARLSPPKGFQSGLARLWPRINHPPAKMTTSSYLHS